jgi:hypothetical protein
MYLPDASVVSLVVQQVPQQQQDAQRQHTHRRPGAGTSAGAVAGDPPQQDNMEWQGVQGEQQPREWVVMQLRPKRLIQVKASASLAEEWQPDEMDPEPSPPPSPQEGQQGTPPPGQHPPPARKLSDRAARLVFPPIPLHDLEPHAKASAGAVSALLQAGVGAEHRHGDTADGAGASAQEPVLAEGQAYR